MDSPHIAVIAECPQCGGRLYERRRRRDGNPFLGCESYPRCDYTAPANADLEAMARELVEMRRRLDRIEAQPVSGKLTKRELRDLLAYVHPDKHPSGNIPAHEIAVRLTALLSKAA